MKRSFFPSVRFRAVFGLALAVILTCSAAFAQSGWEKKVVESIENNDFAGAAAQLDALTDLSEADQAQKDWYFELMRRIRIEFPFNETQIKERLVDAGFSTDDAQMREWEAARQLEMREIDGERRYFKHAVPNLRRVNPELWLAREISDGDKARVLKRNTDAAEIIAETGGTGKTTKARNCVFTCVATLPANAVPEGTVVKYWAPFPRETTRQKNVELISTEPAGGQVAPESDLQRCVYLERTAVKDEPTVFKVVFSTTESAQYFSQAYLLERAKPYIPGDEFVELYTAERLPHMVKSDELKRWTREIVGDETNPVKKVSAIFDAIDARYPWASSNEYGTMFSIPEYVLREGHGDCGMKALLLISACRCEGIPAKWQSGWVWGEDGSCGMHDWAEVFFEGVGWVPVDMSYGHMKNPENINEYAQVPEIRDFYKSGLDQYRLVINDDISRPFTPDKKFFRSEPVDFQRGEMEWDGGNLYFDEWDCDMSVEFND